MSNPRARQLATRPLTFIFYFLFSIFGASSAFALDPSLDISQYAHTSWRVRDGFVPGAITSIAQTPDGYLWLGTDSGLYRFDGVRALLWQPPAGEQLPSNLIFNVLAARDGRLWIGTLKGLASWKDGTLTQYPELAGQIVPALLQDNAGTVWIGALHPGVLCSVRASGVQCHRDGNFGFGVWSLYQDHKGNLWVAGATGLWRWDSVRPEHYPMPGVEVNAVTEGNGGELLLATSNGLKQLDHGRIRSYALPGIAARFRPNKFFRTSDGRLWVGTQQGLLHMHEGRTDVFAVAHSLSGDSITSIFEDREGNVWVSTQDGLDRFREYIIPTVSRNQGLSTSTTYSVQATSDGTVWIGTPNGLNQWQNAHMTVYGIQSVPKQTAQSVARRNSDAGLAGTPRSLGQDDQDRLCVSTRDGIFYFEGNQFIPLLGIPARNVWSIAGDGHGKLWVNDGTTGLFHFMPGEPTDPIPWSRFGQAAFGPETMLPDHSNGGVWLGFYEGGLVYFKDDQIRASYTSADGLGSGRVTDLRFGPRGTLWAATESGLSRIGDGRVLTLTSKNGLPCKTVHWSIEDDDHFLWLYMPCGLVRIARSELDAWVNDPKYIVETAVFNASDGVRTTALQVGYGPHVTKSNDGRIWFTAMDGVSMIDPRHLPYNKVSPPVHIEQVTADGKVYDSSAAGSGGLRLPARIRNLDIDYTALSLVIPERVRFRVKLEGQDKDWRELVNVRHVEYTNLAPKTYRFLVKACNNSGVWNEEGAALAFTIPPMWYQTNWFLALCVAAFLALLWALYQYRLHQMARLFNMRLEERVSERTRIARDLHDTLLQSFHGVLLFLQSGIHQMPEHPSEGMKTLETAVQQAERAIIEGREAVQGLRASTVERNDLALAMKTLGRELGATDNSSLRPKFDVQVEGVPRNLHPILRDEVFRIAGESMRNAFRHSDAKQIEVELRYDERQLRVRVRDDGKGIDPKLLSDHGREGHFGLRGMRERAKLIGGKLTVWSELDAGTEVELSIPASRAYTAPDGQRSWLAEKFAKFSGKDTELKS